ncbi:hypothetical protein OURE66S_04156 [Oligella ureolytica]
MESSYWLIVGVIVALIVCITLFFRLRPKGHGRSWYLGFLLIPDYCRGWILLFSVKGSS